MEQNKKEKVCSTKKTVIIEIIKFEEKKGRNKGNYIFSYILEGMLSIQKTNKRQTITLKISYEKNTVQNPLKSTQKNKIKNQKEETQQI